MDTIMSYIASFRDHAKFTLATEIKGPTVPSLVKCADWVLSPIHYFWGNRKVEIIEKNTLYAVQVTESFPQGHKSWFKAAAFAVLALPSIAIGGSIKACYTRTILWPNEKVLFAKKAIFQYTPRTDKPTHITYAPADPQNQAFRRTLRLFMEHLSSAGGRLSPDRDAFTADEENEGFFLSEVTTCSLHRVEFEYISEVGGWINREEFFRQHPPKPLISNQTKNALIIQNLNLLSNLRHIMVQDALSTNPFPSKIREFLIKLNSIIHVLTIDRRLDVHDENFDDFHRSHARAFFSV